MQLATRCLFHSCPFAANHLCLGNASEWIFPLLHLLSMVARACSRAHTLSLSQRKPSACACALNMLWRYLRARRRTAARSVFGTIARFVQYLCVTLWQVANARRGVGIGRCMHSTQVVRAGRSGDEHYDRSLVFRSKM